MILLDLLVEREGGLRLFVMTSHRASDDPITPPM